MGARAGTSVQW